MKPRKERPKLEKEGQHYVVRNVYGEVVWKDGRALRVRVALHVPTDLPVRLPDPP